MTDKEKYNNKCFPFPFTRKNKCGKPFLLHPQYLNKAFKKVSHELSTCEVLAFPTWAR